MTPWHRPIRRPVNWLILTCSVFLAACSEAESPQTSFFGDDPEPVIWRFALEEQGGSVQDAWAQEFRERIEELSDGSIQVEVYPYGSIGTSPQLTRLVRDGRVQLGFATPGHLSDTVPEAGIFMLPFLFPEKDEDYRQLLADAQLRNMLTDAWQDQGLTLLDIVPEGWMAWTANTPLRSPEDFEGLRIRTMTATLSASLIRAWGAQPVPMAYSEVYQALQLGQVDGQRNPLFSIADMGFHEVQSVLIQPRANRFVTTLVSNRPWFESLDDSHRRWLQQARHGMPSFIEQVQKEHNEQSLQKIVAAGKVQLITLTEAERARFRDASLSLRDLYREQAGPRGQRILDRVLTLTEQ